MGPEVSGPSHTLVPTLLLSSRLYRKWKKKIPNPSKSLMFQVGRQDLLLAPCPIAVTAEKGVRAGLTRGGSLGFLGSPKEQASYKLP